MFDAISRSERVSTRDAELERVDGAARVAFAPELTTLYQRSPCRVLMPRVDGRAGGEIVFVNTAGGIAGGDRLRYEASLAGGGASARRNAATFKNSSRTSRSRDCRQPSRCAKVRKLRARTA